MTLKIQQESLDNVPQINAFLSSSPPNIDLLLNSKLYNSKGAHTQGARGSAYPWSKHRAFYSVAVDGREGVKRISLSEMDLFSLLGKTAHLQVYFKQYLKGYSPADAISAEHYHSLQYAAENGHLETLKFLEGFLSYQQRLEAVVQYDFLLLKNAARCGHAEILKHVLASFRPSSEVFVGLCRLSMRYDNQEASSYLLGLGLERKYKGIEELLRQPPMSNRFVTFQPSNESQTPPVAQNSIPSLGN